MIDLLKRSLAPLTDEAWKEVDAVAARVAKSQLTARKIVDFDGPHGWDYAAVSRGRLEISSEPGPHDVPWGKRLVLPLVETRVPFELGQMELDDIARGSSDADLAPVEDAARRIALFEEAVVYNGFEPAGIVGIRSRCAESSIDLPKNIGSFPEATARGVEKLVRTGFEGPFALILGAAAWTALMQSGAGGFPPHRMIRDLIGGDLLLSLAIEGGLLLSMGGGNFQLTVGQDYAVGYASHDHDKVELFLTASFTFRVLDPKAAVCLNAV